MKIVTVLISHDGLGKTGKTASRGPASPIRSTGWCKDSSVVLRDASRRAGGMKPLEPALQHL
jgi:hypothetical protein